MRQRKVSRRAAIQGSVLLLSAGLAANRDVRGEAEPPPSVRIGLVTDIHHADKPSAGTRFYRDSRKKLEEARDFFVREKLPCIIELGDTIDSADTLAAEQEYLRQFWQTFAATGIDRRCVLGNHCVSALNKAEFLAITQQARTFDSFDLGGFHFILLDACYRKDGADYGRNNFEWTDANIPPHELDWLRSDLERTANKTVVLVHQRLDVPPPYGIQNAAEVRKVLQDSGKVLAVLQGHYHPGDYREQNGIPYCTLSAMIEGSGPDNSAYAVLEIFPDESIRLQGFRKQKGFEKRHA
jgi:alkaline phosphatase